MLKWQNSGPRPNLCNNSNVEAGCQYATVIRTGKQAQPIVAVGIIVTESHLLQQKDRPILADVRPADNVHLPCNYPELWAEHSIRSDTKLPPTATAGWKMEPCVWSDADNRLVARLERISVKKRPLRPQRSIETIASFDQWSRTIENHWKRW